MAKENCSEWANHPYANGSLVGTPTLHRAKVGLLGRRCQHQTRWTKEIAPTESRNDLYIWQSQDSSYDKKEKKKRANRKILHYKWQYKMSSNIHKRITLTCNNSPMDLEPQMLRVVAVGRQTRGTATLTAILTSASQSAASASLSNESPPRFRRIEERARVCTAGLFPLWRTVEFLKKSYPFYTVNSLSFSIVGLQTKGRLVPGLRHHSQPFPHKHRCGNSTAA